jgi:hypothetical protein
VDPLIAARLPWEFVYDTRLESFLLNTEDTTLIRFHPQQSEPSSVAVRLPLRVILAVAGPADSEGASRAMREAKAVWNGVRSLEEEGLIALKRMGSAFNDDPVTRARLEESAGRDVDIIHLIAPCRSSSEETVVVLADDQGHSDEVSSEDFARLFSETSSKLVVLSGGKDAGVAAPELARGLMTGTPAFLVQQGEARADVASRFSGTFYRALAEMKPIDAALADARADAVVHLPMGRGWLAPSVFLSRKDARVFYNEARERVQKVYQLSEGRYRRKLRETLNRIWPKPERYTRQLIRWIPRHEPLTAILQSAEHLGKPQSATSFANRFRRLLLFGDSGAGKTMNLYRLFYEAAQPILSYSAKSPLPMFVSLPEIPSRASLVDFLAEGLDRELFFKDLDEGRFLFLMDSVDGLSSASAKRLSSALNEFMRRYPMNRYVVTARRPLPVSLELPNWVELLPLDEWESMDFLIGDGAMRAESAKLLYENLRQSFGPKVGNPHVLSVARRLWREGASIPTTLSGLHLAFYQVAGATLSPELRGELLPKLALHMSFEDQTSITREQLEQQADSDTGPWSDFKKSEVDDLLTELSKTRLLRGPKAFSFPSLGIQEFLTGLALRSVSIEEVLELVKPAQWTSLSKAGGRPFNLRSTSFHGAVPFLSGFLEDSSELIERLIERDLLLASECYREANSKTAVDDLLRAAIQHALRPGNELLQRVGCLCLEARGDRWAVAVLERVAADPDFSSRVQALEALGSLQSHRSLPLLMAAAKEKDPEVSRAALEALNRMKAS